MARSLSTLLLAAVVALLSACDSGVEPAVAQVSVGATYSGTTLALYNATTGALVYDYLANDAEVEVTFEDADSFAARLFVPYQALVASGETDDLDGDVDQDIAGAYRQRDGALAFVPGGFSDTFFTDAGWTIDADGRSVRYQDSEDNLRIEVVLTRK